MKFMFVVFSFSLLVQSVFAETLTKEGYKRILSDAVSISQEEAINHIQIEINKFKNDEKYLSKYVKNNFSKDDQEFLKNELLKIPNGLKDFTINTKNSSIAIAFKNGPEKIVKMENMNVGKVSIDGKEIDFTKARSLKEVYESVRFLHGETTSFNPINLFIANAYAIDPFMVGIYFLITLMIGLLGALIFEDSQKLKELNKKKNQFQSAVNTCRSDLEIVKNARPGVSVTTDTLDFIEKLTAGINSRFHEVNQKPLTCESISKFITGKSSIVQEVCLLGLDLAECLDETETAIKTKNIRINPNTSKSIESPSYKMIIKGVRGSRL